MPNESQRHSRYHCSGKRPPNLKKVLAQFAKAARGRGYVPNKGVAQSACAKGDREYDNVNRANEVINFLKNTGVLIEVPEVGDDRLFYDAARAAVVLDCCTRGQEPPSAEKDALRIQRISTQFGLIAPSEDGGSGGTEDRSSADAGPAPSQEAASTLLTTADRLTHVLYLTPAEKDVWTALCAEAQETPDGVQAKMPWEPCSDRCTWVAQSMSCGETEYICIVQRFVLAKVLDRIQPADGDHAIFRFTRHPLAYYLVDIAERQPLGIPGADLDVIRVVQAEFEIPHGEYLQPAMEAWGEKRFTAKKGWKGAGLSFSSFRLKYIGYRAGDLTRSLGIMFRKGSHQGRPKLDEVETYMSIPGFEAYDFRPRESAPASVAPPPPNATVAAPTPCACNAAPPAPQPASTTMPSPAPTEAVADVVVCDPGPKVTVVEMPVIPIPSDRGSEDQPFQSLTEPAPPPEVPEPPVPPPVVPAEAPVVRPVIVPPEVPASIESMSDVDLEAKLAEWRRMHEIAQQELVRRRTEKIQRLSAEIADNQFKLTVVVSEAVELETTAAIKRKQASALEDAIAKLRTELAVLEPKS